MVGIDEWEGTGPSRKGNVNHGDYRTCPRYHQGSPPCSIPFSFAFNMILHYRKVGRWKNYLYGEYIYIVLSLVAKTALAWQVFAGTSDQPRGRIMAVRSGTAAIRQCYDDIWDESPRINSSDELQDSVHREKAKLLDMMWIASDPLSNHLDPWTGFLNGYLLLA